MKVVLAFCSSLPSRKHELYRRFGFFIGRRAEAIRQWREKHFPPPSRHERIHHDIYHNRRR